MSSLHDLTDAEDVVEVAEAIRQYNYDEEYCRVLLDALAARLARRLTREQLQALLDSHPASQE